MFFLVFFFRLTSLRSGIRKAVLFLPLHGLNIRGSSTSSKLIEIGRVGGWSGLKTFARKGKGGGGG